MSQQINHIANPTFAEWTGTTPDGWTAVSSTETTVSRLNRTDERGATARTVFDTPAKSSEYIYSGPSSYRATLTSSAVADDWQIRQKATSSVGIVVTPGDRCSVTVVSRGTVAGNLLTISVLGIVTTTDTATVRVAGGAQYSHMGNDFEFVTSTSLNDAVNVNLQRQWTKYGIEFVVPMSITSVSVRLTNGSAGAQVIDLGEVTFRKLASI